MLDINSFIRYEYQTLSREEIIASKVTVLLGVSTGAAETLSDLGINTVFDLGVSHLFKSAKHLSELNGKNDHPIGRYQLIPGDLLDPSANLDNLNEVTLSNIDVLRNVGPATAKNFKKQLGISTLYELGHWHPFTVAYTLVHQTLEDESKFIDLGVPQELVPKFNQYATEKFFYSVYAIDGSKNLQELDELDGPLDLAAIGKYENRLGLRTGAIIRYEQSWMPVGLALGNVLHSLALAPGETTRIAMIDWSRRQGVRTSEDISQAESLSNSLMHTRSINEITRAVAREAQNGLSEMNANSTVSNTAYSGYGVQNSLEALAAAGAGGMAVGTVGAGLGAAGGAGIGGIAGSFAAGLGALPGAGFGALIGGGAGGLIGFAAGGASGFLSVAELGASSNSGSKTVTDVVTTTSSEGERDLFASMEQNITDRTQQHASSIRSKKATIVQEVWQQESEKISTRAVTNYNHMHALTIQYFEVVQMYVVRTRVASVQRCLYIPLKSIEWTNQNIEKYRAILIANALDTRAIVGLTIPPESVVLVCPWVRYLTEDIAYEYNADPKVQRSLDIAKGLMDDHVASSPLEPWVLKQDVILEDYIVVKKGFRTSLFDPENRYGEKENNSALGEPIGNLRELKWKFPELEKFVEAEREEHENEQFQFEIILKLKYEDEMILWQYPLILDSTQYPRGEGPITHTIVNFDHSPNEQWLVDHLKAFSKHYSRAVWRSVDQADLTELLSRYSFEGKPLIDYIDREPVAMSGQYLVFAYHYTPEEQWTDWKKRHGYDANSQGTVEMVPVPTGGVFAEAVQGRANSAEKLDLTRFWNWQDSPIPFNAPEIAAIQSGSRAIASDVRPGGLENPAINIVNPPSLPDPQGMTAMINALATSNMFRDMSGLSEARQLASDALQQAQAGATAAGSQASANLANGIQMTSQAIQKILSMFGDLANTIATTGFGALTGQKPRLADKNASTAGAVYNEAKNFEKSKTKNAGASGDNHKDSNGSPLANNPNNANDQVTLTEDAIRSWLSPGKLQAPNYSEFLPENNPGNLPAYGGDDSGSRPRTLNQSTGEGVVRGSIDSEILLANFNINSARLKPAHEQALDSIIYALEMGDTRITKIVGRASRTGTEDDNMQLSERRIDSVIRYIEQRHSLQFLPIIQPLGESAPLEISGPLENMVDRSVQIFFTIEGNIPVRGEKFVEENPTIQRYTNWSLRVKTSEASNETGFKNILGTPYKVEIKNVATQEILTGGINALGPGAAIIVFNRRREWSDWVEFETTPITNDEWHNTLARITRAEANVHYIVNMDVMKLWFYGVMAEDEAVWIEAHFNIGSEDDAVGLRAELAYHGLLKLDKFTNK